LLNGVGWIEWGNASRGTSFTTPCVKRVVAAMIHKMMAWSSSLHGWMDGKRLKRSRKFILGFWAVCVCVCVYVCVVAAMNITKISKCLGGRKKRRGGGEVPLSYLE